MIDIENEVFDKVAAALEAKFPGITVTSNFERVPESFPHVFMEMSDCFTSGQTNSLSEKSAICVFDVYIFSDKVNGKKSEAKEIAQEVDTVMQSINATRLSLVPLHTTSSVALSSQYSTLYRLVAQYQLTTDGTNFYRR